MESWAIVFSISSLINFGIAYIWPMHQSLGKRIWFTVLFFFIPKTVALCLKYWFFRWGTHLYMSFFPYLCPSVRPSVFCAPYLNNHISSNRRFWYACVKWWYLLEFFHFFESLIFLGWYGGTGVVKGQKIAQDEK